MPDSRDGVERAVSRRRLLLFHLAPVLPAAALLIGMELTPIDEAVSGWFFDSAAGNFPLRHDRFLEIFAHQIARELVAVIAGGVIASYALSFVVPAFKAQRRLLLFLSLALTLAPLAVVLLKAASLRHCPWSLQAFGGFAPHLSLFDAAPPGLIPGHCFPAGHAATGFCLMAFYFAARALARPRLARAVLAASAGAGLALGLGRVAQGAHFVSHVLWSGLVCWVVIVILYRIVVAREARGMPTRLHEEPAGAHSAAD